MRALRQLLRMAGGRARDVVLLAGVAALSLSVQAAERGPLRLRAATASTEAVATATTEARVIVRYRADASVMRVLSASSASGAAANTEAPPQHAQVFAARTGLALVDGAPIGPRSQVLRASGMTSADLAARLSAQSDIEYAVPDQRVHVRRIPSDPLFLAGQATTPATGQWYLRTPGGDGEVASINAEAAWDTTIGTSNIVVAVIDTGITSHPDLTAKILPGYDFITDPTTAGDGNGRDSDPTDPGDGVTTAQVGTITGCTTSDVGPSSWHGTQTAGLIGAATGNGTGMASVGWNVMLLPLRALGKCGGSESDVVAAIYWAAGIAVSGVPANPNKARVINLSLGGDSGAACDSAYQNAVSAAIAQGVVVVAAAGNDGLALGAPANCTGVISVAGVRHLGTKVGYSDLGPNVTIAAPAGNCVNATGTCLYPLLTTRNDGEYSVGNPTYSDGDADPSLGTSFSAPLVSGTVALMLSANPGLTPAQVTTALASTARPFPSTGAPPIQRTTNGPFFPVAACAAPSSTAQGYECYCTTSTCGAGLLDAGAAVASVAVSTVNLVPSAASVVAGASLTIDGSTSNAAAGRTVIGYQWTITGGSSIAAFSGATNQPTVTLATSGAGAVTVSLTVTDSGGGTATSSTTVTVATALPTASLVASSAAVTAGASLTIDGSTSSAAAGRTVVGYQWAITSGSSIAAFSGATNQSTVTLVTSGAGSVTVALTVTDSAGRTATSNTTVTVAAATSSGGGGGGVSAVWLLGLLGAVVALRAIGRRESRPR